MRSRTQLVSYLNIFRLDGSEQQINNLTAARMTTLFFHQIPKLLALQCKHTVVTVCTLFPSIAERVITTSQQQALNKPFGRYTTNKLFHTNTPFLLNDFEVIGKPVLDTLKLRAVFQLYHKNGLTGFEQPNINVVSFTGLNVHVFASVNTPALNVQNFVYNSVNHI
jgi:hypothetical protein